MNEMQKLAEESVREIARLHIRLAAAEKVVEAARKYFTEDMKFSEGMSPRWFKNYHEAKRELAAYDALQAKDQE